MYVQVYTIICVYICISEYIYASLSLYIYIYICVYIYVVIYIYIYIYFFFTHIYIYRCIVGLRARSSSAGPNCPRPKASFFLGRSMGPVSRTLGYFDRVLYGRSRRLQ